MSDYWPHKFTKLGEPIKIGEEQIMSHTSVPIMTQRMICMHCKIEYTHNIDSQPIGQCPARNTEDEMKRLKK